MQREPLRPESSGSAPDTPGRRPNSGLRWCVTEDYEAMSRLACSQVIEELRRKPTALIGLATGATPGRTYELLTARGQADPDLCARAVWLKLDEWGGLAMDDPATCEAYLRKALIEPLQIADNRFIGWHSAPAAPEAECRRIAAWLAAHGPIDLQILGLGQNGHLGFNEPADVLQPGPHIAELSPTSLAHSMLSVSQGNVRYGLTLGIEDLLGSRKILLLVNGQRKAGQLARLITEPPSPHFPASILWHHADVTLICDRAAAELLPAEMVSAAQGETFVPLTSPLPHLH